MPLLRRPVRLCSRVLRSSGGFRGAHEDGPNAWWACLLLDAFCDRKKARSYIQVDLSGGSLDDAFNVYTFHRNCPQELTHSHQQFLSVNTWSPIMNMIKSPLSSFTLHLTCGGLSARFSKFALFCSISMICLRVLLLQKQDRLLAIFQWLSTSNPL